MFEPQDEKPKISNVRIGLWILGAGVGVYMIVSGLVGALS